jgi:hypothetical protein
LEALKIRAEALPPQVVVDLVSPAGAGSRMNTIDLGKNAIDIRRESHEEAVVPAADGRRTRFSSRTASGAVPGEEEALVIRPGINKGKGALR